MFRFRKLVQQNLDVLLLGCLLGLVVAVPLMIVRFLEPDLWSMIRASASLPKTVTSNIEMLPGNSLAGASDGKVITNFHSASGATDGTVTLHFSNPLTADAVLIVGQVDQGRRLPHAIEITASGRDGSNVVFSGVVDSYKKKWTFRRFDYLLIPFPASIRDMESLSLSFNGVANQEYLTFSELAVVDSLGTQWAWEIVGACSLVGAILLITAYLVLIWMRTTSGFQLENPNERAPSLAFMITALIGISVVFFLSQSPVLNSGYFGDDYRNSMLRGTIDSRGIAVAELVAAMGQQIGSWAVNAGRFFPVAVVSSMSFNYALPDLISYRVVGTLLLLADALLMALLVYRFTRSPMLALVFLAVLPMLLVVRAWHDALLGYVPLLSSLLFFLLSSAYAFVRAHEGRWRAGYLLSGLFFAFALMTYEVAFCFLPMFLLLNFALPRSSELTQPSLFRRLWPTTFAWVLVLVINIVIRALFGQHYIGTQFSLDVRAVIETLTFQVSGTLLPFALSTITALHRPDVISMFVVAGVVALSFYGLFHLRVDRKVLVVMMFAGGLWILASAFVVSFSQKFQTDVSGWGVAYLPVLSQYFGLALVLSALFGILTDFARKWNSAAAIIMASLLSLTVGLVTLKSYQNNQNVVTTKINPLWKYPRELLSSAIKRGLLGPIEEGATIVVDRIDGIWKFNEGFFFQELPRHYHILYSDEVDKATWPIEKNVYLLRLGAVGERRGEVLLSKVLTKEWELGKTWLFDQDGLAWSLTEYPNPVQPQIAKETFANKIAWTSQP